MTPLAALNRQVALVLRDTLYVANAGDANALLFAESGEVELLTVEHKADNPDEKARVEALGGIITSHRGGPERVQVRCAWRVPLLENIRRYLFTLASLECQVSTLANDDTCPRPTTLQLSA
jgi:hypothetical protein